jgi:hypothetical protein
MDVKSFVRVKLGVIARRECPRSCSEREKNSRFMKKKGKNRLDKKDFF